MMRSRTLLALSVALSVAACKKQEPAGGGSAAPAPAPATATATAAAQPGPLLGAKTVTARLEGAGVKITEPNTGADDGWPFLDLKFERGNPDGEDYRSGRLDAELLGQPAAEGDPAPYLAVGTGALIRLSWRPSRPGAAGPDLAAFAKELTAITSIEKATDELFQSPKFDAVVKAHGLSVTNNRSRATDRGVFNTRELGGADGSLEVDLAYYAKGLADGTVVIAGGAMLSVESEDKALAKTLLAAVAK
jgi:hypothetical protein